MRANLGITELAHLAALDLAAELRRHGLHAVANPEHRNTQIEHDLRCFRRLILINRIRSAGEDDACRLKGTNIRLAHVPRMQFAIDVSLAHAAGDKLGVLGTEIEDEDFLMHVF